MRRTRALILTLAMGAAALTVPAAAQGYINEWTRTAKTPLVSSILRLSPNFATDRTIFIASKHDTGLDNGPANGGLARSTDAGVTWTRPATAAGASSVSALALAPDYTLSAGIVLAGTDDEKGKLLRSGDGGSTWTRVGAALPGVGPVVDICFSPAFATDRTVFVTYTESYSASEKTDYVAFSKDGGVTWQTPNRGWDGTTLDADMKGAAAIVVGQAASGASDEAGRRVLRSTDGERWVLSSSVDVAFTRVDMVSSTTAFAIAKEGSIWRTLDGGATWEKRGTVPPGGATSVVPQLQAIDMLDADTGYVTGMDLSVYKTANGGATWTDVSPVAPEEWDDTSGITWWGGFASVVARTATDVWAAQGSDGSPSENPTLFHTADGGRMWSPNKLPAPSGLSQFTLYSIAFGDAQHGCVAGAAYDAVASALHSLIYRTADGGNSWSLVYDRVGFGVFDMAYKDASTIFATGWSYGETDAASRIVIRSSDGGMTWSKALGGVGGFYQPVAFGDATHGLIGSDDNLYSTGNGGATWAKTNTGGVCGALAISSDFARDRTVLVATGTNSSDGADTISDLWRSTDGGLNWAPVPTASIAQPLVAIDYSPTFATDHTMFAIDTTREKLYRSTNSGSSWRAVLGPLDSFYRGESRPQFSNGWATDHTMFVVLFGQMFKSVNGGASFYALGSYNTELDGGFGIRADFSANPVAYSVVWNAGPFRDYLWAYRFGPRQKARPSKPTAFSAVDRKGKLIVFRGTILPLHPPKLKPALSWEGPPVKVYLERYSGGRYRPYKSYTLSDLGSCSSGWELVIRWNTLTVGKYRIRAFHTDSGEGGHLPSYGPWLNFTRAATFRFWVLK